MFKAAARWRSDKNHKITAVFKLQFHATQVSEFGGNGLVLSLVPAENGKPTARLENCVLRENGCYWENPVYETVKFVQDPKTGKIAERIYYFIISAGAPKGSLVGEFSVNIADYFAGNKACSISFPFKNNHHSHLHVSIQRIQENSNQRDLEENESIRIKLDDKSLRQHFSDIITPDGIKTDSSEDEPLRKTVPLLPGVNGIRRGSNGSDITLSSSDGSSVLDTPTDLRFRSNNTNKDQTLNGTNYEDQQRIGWELAIVPLPANGSSTYYSMNSPSERSQVGIDGSVEKLRADLIALSRRAEVSELELQTLRKQIVKESKKGQDMWREIISLKEERDALKDDCEKLKASSKRSHDFKEKNNVFEGDPWTLINVMREELGHEKDLNANLRLQLQKTQESNDELLFAVQDLEEEMEKNNRGVSVLPNRLGSGVSVVEIEDHILKCQSSDDEEQKALEEIVRQHSDAHESYVYEQKIMDLCSEIEMYRRDKDELEMQMEQLALDYEILKQENHEFTCRLEQSHLQDQLKPQYEFSSSHAAVNEIEAQSESKEQHEEISHYLATIKELESGNKSLVEDLKRQAERFRVDKEAITRAWMEQEQRAAQAEEALTQSNVTIDELGNEIAELKKEIEEYLEQQSASLATIHKLETHNSFLEGELEKQAQGFEANMEALGHAKLEQEQRALKAEEAVASSNATISDLDAHIKKLENELKKQSEESSHAMATLKELEAHIQYLEEEMDKQAEGFEADLGAVVSAKVEQEKRAIQAEGALKSLRWKNVNTAEKIKEEFKRLSAQMQLSFEASEKLASKALSEARELRLQNHHLHKANEDLMLASNNYKTNLEELYSQINMKSTQIERAHVVQQVVSGENMELKAEVRRLISENKLLNEEAEQGGRMKSELEQMKALINERDLLLEGTNGSLKKSIEEVRHAKDMNGQVGWTLESEVKGLRAQCDNLKHSVYEDEMEKEKLRQHILQLKAELKKKDEAISRAEKKSKENDGQVTVHERSGTTSKNTKSESKQCDSEEVITLKELIKLLEGQSKSKEAAMEITTTTFLAKDKELHGKIQKLQARLDELGVHSPDLGQDKVEEEKISVKMQVNGNADEVTLAIDDPEEVGTTTEFLDNLDLTDSHGNSSSSTQSNPPDNHSHSHDQQKFDILLKEMVFMKENNNSMETELKEMQERYSEISLKFAEVEGERQRLVMRLRNIKNAKNN